MGAMVISKFVKSFVGRPRPSTTTDVAPQLITVAARGPNPTQTSSGQPSKPYALGYELARQTRALKPDSAMLKALEEQVMALAVHETLPPFNLANLADKRTFARLEELDEELVRAMDDRDIAAAEVRKRSDDLAKCGGVRPYPVATSAFRWIATAAITLSVAPALYGFFGGLFPLLKWLLAIGFGGTISLLIVTAILPDDKPKDEENAK